MSPLQRFPSSISLYTKKPARAMHDVYGFFRASPAVISLGVITDLVGLVIWGNCNIKYTKVTKGVKYGQGFQVLGYWGQIGQ
jgi:hypothetical protein